MGRATEVHVLATLSFPRPASVALKTAISSVQESGAVAATLLENAATARPFVEPEYVSLGIAPFLQRSKELLRGGEATRPMERAVRRTPIPAMSFGEIAATQTTDAVQIRQIVVKDGECKIPPRHSERQTLPARREHGISY
jgi:hypothetical protein